MHHFKAPQDMFHNAERYDDYLEDVDFPMPETGYEPQWGSVATRGKNDSLIDYIGSSLGKRNRIRNMGKDLGIDQTLPDEEYKKEAYQLYMKRYFRCIKGVDDNVKRIFNYFEKEGLMDNTIIIYTSDQGFFLGEHDFIDPEEPVIKERSKLMELEDRSTYAIDFHTEPGKKYILTQTTH